MTEPVQLAPQKGYGEVNWKAPIKKNSFEVQNRMQFKTYSRPITSNFSNTASVCGASGSSLVKS